MAEDLTTIAGVDEPVVEDEPDGEDDGENNVENGSDTDDDDDRDRDGGGETDATENRTVGLYPQLTKYEYARIIGERAEQITRNCPTLAEIDDEMAEF